MKLADYLFGQRPSVRVLAALLALAVAPSVSIGEDSSVSKAPPPVGSAIRIKAGVRKPLTDSEGKVWLPDQGFVGGVIADRDVATEVFNTKTPEIYRSERYGMSSFSYAIPNGNYTVNLYFAEMYGGVGQAEMRVFSLNIAGREIRDLDIWAAAGGSRRALVETVKVEIRDGKLTIQFLPKIQYPTINAIEILPEL